MKDVLVILILFPSAKNKEYTPITFCTAEKQT